MGSDDGRLPPSMREALKDTVPAVSAGKFAWREIEPGFEVAEMPVVSATGELDRILLNRIDPQSFRFVVRSAPAGDKGLDEWEQTLPDAVLLVNGSYFDHRGKPDTPFLSEGEQLGPREYKLASFLKDAPLDLTLALNLDGGPIACQSVRLHGFQRKFYAQWEAQVREGVPKEAEVSLLRWPFSQATWAMPVVLAVERAR